MSKSNFSALVVGVFLLGGLMAIILTHTNSQPSPIRKWIQDPNSVFFVEKVTLPNGQQVDCVAVRNSTGDAAGLDCDWYHRGLN